MATVTYSEHLSPAETEGRGSVDDARALVLWVAAAIIAVGAILAAVLWPDTTTCVANCNASQNILDQSLNPTVFVVDHHVGLRILVAAAGLALATVIVALSFSKTRVTP